MSNKKLRKAISFLLTVLLIISICPIGELAGLDMSWLSPEITASAATNDEFKVVLSWGSNPSDLDSHITGPTSGGSTFHVYYQNKSAHDGNQVVASLDKDITTGYGPETTTLYPVNDNNRYTYYVYNYSGSGTIPTSNAKIDLYKNGNLIKSFSPPNINSSGRTWTVFAIQNGTVYTINTISDKMNASSGSSKTSTLSANKNDIVITPKGRLIAELESNTNIGIFDNFFNKKANAQLTDVNVAYNSTNNKTTSENPSFTIAANNNITGDVTLSKEDFRDYKIPKKVLESWKNQSAQTPVNNSAPQYQHDAYMTQKVKDGKPYISTVFARVGNTAPFEEITTKSITINSDIDYEIQISAGDIAGADCTYYLQQDQTHVVSNKTGIFTAADELHTKLERGKKTYAVVKTADGKRSDYEEVNIDIEATTFLQKAQDYMVPGTKLKLLGEDFAKFTVPSNLPLVGGAEISFEAFQLPAGFEFDVEEGSLMISVGANIFEASKEKGDKKYTKEMFKNWKDLTKQSIGQSMQDKKDIKKTYDTNKNVFMDKWGGSMPAKSSKNWGISSLGYLEIVFTENGCVVKEACITVEGEFSFKYNVQAAVGPVPVYFYVEAGAALGGTALGVNPVEENVQFNLTSLDWDFSIKLEPKLKAGGGAGIKDFASVGIYAKATLPTVFSFKQKHLTMDLTGEFGVEAELWLLKGSVTLLDGTVHIIDKYWNSGSSKNASSVGDSADQAHESEVVYSLVDRDYANNTSSWLGDKKHPHLIGVSAPQMNFTNLQTSIYPNAVPQVVTFGDKMLMAWVEDSSDRDDYNRMRLMYSVYDNGIWSQPKAVYDDGKNDNIPVITSDGTNVYFAWQKQASIMDSEQDNTFETILSDVDLYTAKYDANTQTINNISRVTENNCYDYAQKLSIINGKPVLYWASCNDNQLLGSGNNTLKRMELGKEAQVVKDNLNYILDLDAALVNGKEEVSFATDKDGDYETTNDVTVFTYSDGTLYEFLKTDNTVACPVLFYGNPAGQTTLYVSDMKNIYYNDSGITKSVLSNDVPIQGNLQFVGDANNNRLIWTQTEETGNAIYSSSFENGEWTSPISIGNNGTELADVNAVMYKNSLRGVCTSTELTYNEDTQSYQNGTTNLCFFSLNGTPQDLAIEEISIDERDIHIGEASPFTVLLANHGCNTAESVTFTITDDLGSKYTQTVDVQLESGETCTVTLDYIAPDNYQKTNLYVVATSNNFPEADMNNNIIQQEIGVPKLVITESGVSKVGSEYIVNALVTNESDIPVDSAVVKLCSGYEGTDDINFAILSDMSARSTHLVEFTIPEELLIFDDTDTTVVSLEIKDESVKSNKETIVIKNLCTECAHPDTFVDTIEATCTKDGYQSVHCVACGEFISETYIEKLGHSIIDDQCERCDLTVGALTLDQYSKVTISSEQTTGWFKFIPDTDGDYYFYSDSTRDTYGQLYDSQCNLITSNDDSGDDENFKIKHYLEKDNVYYLEARFYGSSQGELFVKVSKNFTSCHNYEITTIPATCTESGYDIYQCSICNHEYTTNYTDQTGHNVRDGQCANCGLSIGTLTLDQYSKVTISSEQTTGWFKFIPDTDGDYYFYSDSTRDTYGQLYDSQCNLITSNDDSGGDGNFKIEYYLEKNNTYYLKTYFYGHEQGEFFVKVTKNFTSCHNYEITTIPPTCTDEGYDIYHCTICGVEHTKNYVDSLNQAHQFVLTVVPPTCISTGYTIYHCSLCNYEYKDNYTNLLPHTIEDLHCTVCGKSGAELYESVHPYENHTNQEWVIHKDNAKLIEITFSKETKTESGYDYIYIYDKDNNELGRYSGTELAGKTIKVTGDTATIKMVTDGSVSHFGFSLDKIIYYHDNLGDANLDGRIDINDVTAIQKHLVELNVLTKDQLAAADIDCDGIVDIHDATKLAKQLIGL